MENEIYKILKKHKLPLKKREEVLTDLLLLVVGQSEQLVCPHCKGLEVYIDEYGGKPCMCTKQAN